MRVVVMGTGGFILPSFKELLNSEQEIVGLITMPKREKGRSAAERVFPLRDLAIAHKIPIYEPADINSPEGLALLRELAPDVIFVCDYGKILSAEVISMPRYGGLNLHGSLLPAWRGAAPINRALAAGDTRLGVSILHITPEVDAGPVVATVSYIPSMADTAVEVESRLSRLGAPLVLDSVRRLEGGTLSACGQDQSRVSRAPKLRKEEGRLKWDRTTREVVNQYRAMQPWPKTYTTWLRPDGKGGEPVLLILSSLEPAAGQGEPGTVLEATGEALIVATGDGAVRIGYVQPAGKRRMEASAFLRGYKVKKGDILS
ncbi:MAG: methionyl-tRNA formyltransferase [Planctomycetia bacterium]|nr:methionyl-tRNA formyltransferase [Planctomycetia bacterium]